MASVSTVIGTKVKSQLVVEQSAPVGVRDALDPSDANNSLAFEMKNVYPSDPFVGDGVRHRPGTTLSEAQITSGQCQRGYQFTKLDGTEYTVQIVKGEIYTYNWGTDAYTKVVSAANLSTGSVALSTTAICYATTYVDNMIISDGVNIVFAWNGASGAGGLTDMTNTPVTFGQPVVHYAKLFLIKNAERNVFVWSEENSLNTGYEAGGFNNSWQLGQTDQEALFCLIPTDEALYYTRERSTGAIWGAVNDAFRTTGTHDAVSSSIGCKSPRGWVRAHGHIYLVDADARFQKLLTGGGYQDPGIWRDAREGIKGIDRAKINEAEAVWNQDTDLVHFGVVLTGDADKEKVFNFQATTGQFVGHYDGFTFDTLDMLKDATGKPTMSHGDASGYTWQHAHASSQTYDDEDNTGTAASVPHAFESSALLYNIRQAMIFERLDLVFLSEIVSGVNVFTRTSSAGLATTGLVLAELSLALWNTAVWDTDLWSDFNSAEVRESLGIDAYGRWIRIRLTHDVLGQGFGYGGLAIEAFSDGPDTETS